jgi:hypothetical protein
MANNLLGWQRLRTLLPLCVCLGLSQLPRLEAAEANAGEDQMRQAVRQAVELAHPGANVDELNMAHRDDLDEELSQLSGKTKLPIAFYSFYGVDSDDGSVWAVVSANSPQGSHEIYSFEDSDGAEQSSQKFNQMLSRLGLAVPRDKAPTLARFFLGCCVRGAPGENITDQTSLRHAVERFYIRVYGDVWRALEAGTDWWERYEKTAVPLTSTVMVRDGVRQIVLNRLVLSFGMHPQLQQWRLAVSSDGSIRILAVDSIFPRQRRWLSYAFRTNLAPDLH